MNKKQKPRYKPKRKNKIEFSKKWLIACVVVSIFYTSLSYLFAWFDKNALESLSISINEMLWGTSGVSFIGYVLQNCCRAYTASKFGIPDYKLSKPENKICANKKNPELSEPI